MLSDDELLGSMYYPACGLDTGPLCRFSPTVRTFVYADWTCAEADVQQAFERDFSHLRYVESCELTAENHEPARLKIDCTDTRNHFSNQTGTDDKDALAASDLFPPGFRLRAIEEQNYHKHQQSAPGVLAPWAREFRYRATHSEQECDVRLVYFSDEALARYCVTYVKRDIAPRIVCTIHTDPKHGNSWTCLEDPDGALKRLFERCPRQPRIWIRGGPGGAPRGISEWSVAIEQFPDCEATAFARDGDERAKIGIKATVTDATEVGRPPRPHDSALSRN